MTIDLYRDYGKHLPADEQLRAAALARATGNDVQREGPRLRPFSTQKPFLSA